jgi:outer membrane biosynthesis protein TonB
MAASAASRRWQFVILVASGLAVLAIIAWGLYSLSGGGGASRPKPPKISLLPNTPPPPPPPKDEKKPEPPKEQREVKMEQPQLKDAPPPDQTLKMEGPAGNAPSAIQAGTVTNENLSNIGGKGDGRGNNPFAFYTNMLQQQLQSEFSRNQKLRNGDYRAQIRIWIARDGSISRYELSGSSGNAQTDELIKSALAAMPPFRDPPPDTMPQPVRLRITSRSTG